MRLLLRIAAALCCLVPAGLALIVWDATGRAGWTRYHDPARAERDRAAASEGLGDLFEGAGLNEGRGGLAKIPNDFALGLGPSGPGKHAASVATIAGPALVAALYTLLPNRRQRAVVRAAAAESRG